jgi:hypothetical protein
MYERESSGFAGKQGQRLTDFRALFSPRELKSLSPAKASMEHPMEQGDDRVEQDAKYFSLSAVYALF